MPRSPKASKKKQEGLANVAFKTAFTLTCNEQQSLLEQGFGIARFSYNWALAEWEKRRSEGHKNSFINLRNQLNKVKKQDYPWMAAVPKDIPAEAIRDLTVAFKNFFDKSRARKVAYPKHKKKGRCRFSFRLPTDRLRFRQAPDVAEAKTQVYLSTIGWVTLAEAFEPVGRVVYATISRKADRYFISFCMEYAPVKTQRRVLKPKAIGIDLGLLKTLTLSNGTVIQSPRSLSRNRDKLAQANRRLHKRVKGSKNRVKAARLVARIHQKTAYQRRDFVEKVTTRLLRAYDIIALEDLNVAGLMQSGRLSRSLSDAAFGQIVLAFDRKAKRFGCRVEKVSPFFPSSKQCRKCKTKNHGLTLADRQFNCPDANCGHSEERDLHAARAILQEVMSHLPGATGEVTPVERWSLPSKPVGIDGKPARRSRKPAPREPVMSKAGQRQNPRRSTQVIEQVC